MQQNDNQIKRRKVAPLSIVLGIVFVFFCGVLVYVYAATKRINPVMLDEHGRPINQLSASEKH
jgi:hypothetical protein